MTSNATQLYLLIDASATGLARLAAILAATPGIAAVLIRPGQSSLDAASARPLVELAQKANVAALLENDATLARALRADGVHLDWSPDLRVRFDDARDILGQRFMVGVGIAPHAELARHDAMELAEAGADYIAFQPGDGQSELTAWWSEIFEVPCVTMDVANGDDAAALLATARPDFIAVAAPAAVAPADCAAHVAMIALALHPLAIEGTR